MQNILPFILMLGLMYVLLVRPQQQRVKRQQQLLASLEVGDEVITAGGMIGHIRSLTDERASVEVAPGVEIAFLRGAISHRTAAPTGVIDVISPEED